jgi:hypothetical protein
LAGLHPTSATYEWAAIAAIQAGDNDAGVRIAERGIQAAPWSDHPDAAGCWAELILAHLASGRDGAASEAAQHLAIIEPTLSDPWDRCVALQALIDNGFANDRGSVLGLVARLSQVADEIGAPSIMSQTSFYRASGALHADPPDPERAFTAARQGVAIARTAGDRFVESWNNFMLAVAALALHRPDAMEICRDAMVRLYEIRDWLMLWPLVEHTAGYFAGAGMVQDAAVIYGHLDAHHAPWGAQAARRARQQGLDRVRQLAEYDLLMAEGADMDRDQLVIYTLDRLAQAVPAHVEPA